MVRALVENDARTGSLAAWPAWVVHSYTASGAVLAFVAMQAAAAVVIDSTDGVLARSARVHERVPDFSGQKLDDIADYLTFVFVPAVILWQGQAVAGVRRP